MALNGHPAAVWNVKSSRDHTAIIWEVVYDFREQDSESLIFNLSNHKIHMWDLTGTKARPSTYCGHRQSASVTHSCFGGLENSFLVGETEDSKVCIWNQKNENPLVVLSGHVSTVKCVSWNPERPQMLASASDDGTIRIWGPQDLCSQEVHD